MDEGGSKQQTLFDLEVVPEQKRSRVWKDALNEFFYDFEFSLPNDFSSGRIEGCYAGGLSVASVESDAMSVWRTEAQIARDPLDAYFVLLPTGSRIALSQRGHQALVGGREFAIVSTSTTYEYIQKDATRFNNLIIPGHILRQVAPHADDFVARAGGSKPVEEMFSEFASSFCMKLTGIDPSSREALSRQAVELLGLVLDGVDRDSTATPIRLAHRRRIIQLIDRHYADPKFDLDVIAATLRISRRYIQAIFTANGETVTEVLRRRRIAEAIRLLQMRKTHKLTVTQIAFRVGFADLAHFSRVFKDETGSSPSNFASEGDRTT